MKTKTTTNLSTETWIGATTKGALVWGSVYSTATTGATCLLTSAASGAQPAMTDIFVNSLIIFPPIGALRGFIMWHVRKGLDKTANMETDGNRKPEKQSWKAKRAA